MLMTFNNNEFKAQNTVIQKSKLDLDKIVRMQKEKENPVKPTPPKIPTPQPSPVKPPDDLPKIIKPSQVKPNRITDTGTGGLSAFQAAKNVKHISGVDYNYLLSWFKGNEIKAQEVVINLEEDELRGMIGKQKGLSGQVSVDKREENKFPTFVSAGSGFDFISEVLGINGISDLFKAGGDSRIPDLDPPAYNP